MHTLEARCLHCLYHPLPYFLRQRLSLNLELISWLAWLASEPSLPILGLQVHTEHLAFYISVADRIQTFMLIEQALYPLNLIPYCPLFSLNLCVHVVMCLNKRTFVDVCSFIMWMLGLELRLSNCHSSSFSHWNSPGSQPVGQPQWAGGSILILDQADNWY